jgi:probable rRNA maturation factor
MITFQIEEAYQSQIDTGRLGKAVLDTLHYQKFNPNGEVSIVIGDDDHIQALNQTYRGIDEPTDVLAFPYDVVDPDTGQENLGDIIIAYPRAAMQAEEGGHPVMDELILLVVHGTLHLLGYDHDIEEEKAAMWSAQDDILEGLEVSTRPHD